MTMVALLADIHANAPALEAVLSTRIARDVSTFWCAGDVVGYNAFARETIALAKVANVLAVHGNHDLMVTGRLSMERAGPRARRAVAWTRAQLSSDERKWLESLPGSLHVADGVICVHSTLGDTERRMTTDDDYRLQAKALREADPTLRVSVCGHTHQAGVVRVAPDGRVQRFIGARVDLAAAGTWFVNPGSVGEPRDGDMRASFAVLEWPARRVHFHRVRYNRSAVSRVNAVRLPAPPQRGGWLRAIARRLASAQA